MKSLAAAILLGSHLLAFGQACDEAKLENAALQLLKAPQSGKCRDIVGQLNADKFWSQACDRLNGKYKDLHAEFARRTAFYSQGVKRWGGLTLVLHEIHGPSPEQFSIALSGGLNCSGEKIDPVLDAAFPASDCGEAFWKNIPVEKYQGAVAAECRSGNWFIVNPNGVGNISDK
ncbi:hypothetical protein QRD43_01810 [Pelomonas sp. APW6]|uniref:Uncharacterized protein n=1 Tax=Roseateles subflavus TaxID=3053353 RepID=A0ABT7LEB6_9BURK|nr:hypothetical protein [Pelomonas sp. APW6]MDL5030627.1 hypothetical protein [Pelomonas sp. APW6]